MIKLGGVTIFVIIFMSLLFGVDPAKVMVTLIEVPLFQLFFLSSLLVAVIFPFMKNTPTSEDIEK